MFYDNLKEICTIRGLKITKVVTECGGSLGSIDKWKKGAYPNSGIVIELSLYLGVTTDYLLLGKDSAGIFNNISNSNVGAVGNQGTVTVNASEDNGAKNDFTNQFMDAFNSLDLGDKVEAINFVFSKIKK